MTLTVVPVIAPQNLLALMNHLNGKNLLSPAEPGEVLSQTEGPDLRDVRGQEKAKHALEIAAAGRHHILIIGSIGAPCVVQLIAIAQNPRLMEYRYRLRLKPLAHEKLISVASDYYWQEKRSDRGATIQALALEFNNPTPSAM